MIEAQRYEAALFNQLLAGEFHKAPHDLKGGVGRALVRFSPGASPSQQRAYTESLLSTILNEEGEIHSDWPQKVIEEHWD